MGVWTLLAIIQHPVAVESVIESNFVRHFNDLPERLVLALSGGREAGTICKESKRKRNNVRRRRDISATDGEERRRENWRGTGKR